MERKNKGLVDDFWGGLTAMLVALPSSVAFGVLTYATIDPAFAGIGAMAGMMGAVALGLVTPWIGRTGGLIAAPCAPAAAVLSAEVLALMDGTDGVVLSADQVMPLLALTALCAAVLQIVIGLSGGGRLIKFIPYPVVTGYLSGVALLIALKQLPKLLATPADMSLIDSLLAPGSWRWQSLVVGLTTILFMVYAPRITQKIPAAIVGLLAGVASYFLVAMVACPELLVAQGNTLIIGSLESDVSLFQMMTQRVSSLLSVEFSSLKLILVPALTLGVLLSVDTLKTCVSLDALTRSRHHSDRELMGQGVGNIASFLVGGMPGAGTMGPTLVNVTSGGHSPYSGAIEGGLVLLAILFLTPLIAWVPIATLAGILMVIAWRMFDKTMFRLLRYPSGRTDFLVIASVVLVAVTVDLIAAAGAGVALAILLFIREQVQGSVLRRKFHLNQHSSKTRRLVEQREALSTLGEQALFCELQGNLFFGTTDQLFTQLEQELASCRFILLDMRRVQSMDYTAANLFRQMQLRLAERGGQLLFSGLPRGMIEERSFQLFPVSLGSKAAENSVMVAETLEGALEWMEDEILKSANLLERDSLCQLSAAEFELFAGMDEETLTEIASVLKSRTLKAGEKLFAQGDKGDELFLVCQGEIRILLAMENHVHHLATICRGDFFGELSFLDQKQRSADAVAKGDCRLFELSRKDFDKHFSGNGTVATAFFSRLALAIGERLRQA
ncbi:MAG: SLC26A/SulP transporter family protein, partial [Pseudomonadales bacterium]|nr:SLC26A/SulP transporter family protein [Pseudomonadales bacterium]